MPTKKRAYKPNPWGIVANGRTIATFRTKAEAQKIAARHRKHGSYKTVRVVKRG